MTIDRSRRTLLGRLLAVLGAAPVSGCDMLSRSSGFGDVLATAEALNERIQHLVASRVSMAQEFTEADLSPRFRSNGTAEPASEAYRALAAGNFADYRLKVTGLVERPGEFSLAQLRELPARTQITRHDCVEGWSAIGKWEGARLGALLELVRPLARTRYVVFHCADPMEDDAASTYYESIDLEDARHPQTILAYALNGSPLPVENGAPIRVRVERQLGYKMAKYIMAVELVESFAHIRGGRGGYWEDRGYEWYAGI